jgi:hypothetical protein
VRDPVIEWMQIQNTAKVDEKLLSVKYINDGLSD